MIRRRRPAREVPFGFDSFLDVVANVVGIIIRLILVAWVGARSYDSLPKVIPPAVPDAAAHVAPEPEDPLRQELDRYRQELAQAEERLLEQLRQVQQVQAGQADTEGVRAALAVRRQELLRQEEALDRTTAEQGQLVQTAALSLAELRLRGQRLNEEIRALRQLPSPKRALYYRVPVSRPVQAEELMFECRYGRVTFLDLATLLAEVRRGLEDKGQLLRTRWEVTDSAGPVGAFRLRYTVERERGVFDALAATTVPEATGGYRYGLSAWEAEPVAPVRGETAAAALAGGSEFRQIVDVLDPRQTAVTFWVYPDSFDLFRRLRDYLYDRDVVVAGRPLPEGIPIASSRRGTVSRGQ
jgi:hypothetical protein